MINSFEEKILSCFGKSSEVNLYFLYRVHKISPGDLVLAVRSLRKKKLISKHKEQLTLTKKGREVLLINKKKYFFNKPKPWLTVPLGFKIDRKIDNNDPLSLNLDNEFFKKLEIE